MLPSQVTSLSCSPPSAHHLTLINSLAVGLFASIFSVCEAECFFFFFLLSTCRHDVIFKNLWRSFLPFHFKKETVFSESGGCYLEGNEYNTISRARASSKLHM